MTAPTVIMRGLDGEHAFEEILAEIDRNARGDVERWAEKRRAKRKRIRLKCSIHYICQRTDATRTAIGRTRDLSTTGMGVLCNIHFLRRTSIAITVPLHDGRTKQVCGKVTYSRLVREGWFLTGVRFERTTDKRLRTAGNTSAKEQGRGDVSEKGSNPLPTGKTHTKTVTARERALATLSAVQVSKGNTKQAMAKLAAMSVSPDHAIRKATVPVFMELGNRDGILGLISLLKDANSEIQGDAADALGTMRAVDSVGALKELLTTADAKVSLQVAAALGQIGDRGGLAFVVGYLNDDGPHTKLAARALGIIVGQNFRPTRQGVIEARRYINTNKL